jgi:GxxExxY protein
LKKLDLSVEKNRELDLIFEGETVGQMKANLVVENKVLVQIFRDKELDRFNEQKVYNQLKASELPVGLILNFGLIPEFKRKDAA